MRRWHEAGGQWAQTFDAFLLPSVGGRPRATWERIPPLEHPEALDLGGSNAGSLMLFREPDTGRCIALHVRY